eukprot:SAG31_NODE_7268_length_1737_cov_4.735043_2_plen_104_part_00
MCARHHQVYHKAPQLVTLKSGRESQYTITRLCPATCDTVLWNPYVAKSKDMADFGDDEWRSMVCVEPGVGVGFVTLQAGERWELAQVLAEEEEHETELHSPKL